MKYIKEIFDKINLIEHNTKFGKKYLDPIREKFVDVTSFIFARKSG